MDAMTYNRMFTLHGVTMVWMFLIPSIPTVFGNFVLPMQLGARDLAFPRLNLASFYVYVAGHRDHARRHARGRHRHRLDVLHAVQRQLADARGAGRCSASSSSGSRRS